MLLVQDMSAGEYDIFLSHAWADGERPQQIAAALSNAGLHVWFDATEINDFASITRAVTEGLAKSKALVAYYSKTYPLRRACQWELTAAFLTAQRDGDPRRRVLVINPEEGADHIHPIELRDAKFPRAPKTSGEMQRLVQSIVKQVAAVDSPLADIHPLTAPNWYGVTPVGSTRFVGRLKEMWEIHSLLHAGDVTQITGAATATGGIGQVQGLGGVGKSLLAEEYALHFGAAYPGGVFWVRAYGNDDAKSAVGPEQREVLRTDQVRQIAERLGIDARGLTPQQIEGELTRKIESRGQNCLWVVDDMPTGLDGEALRRWFAPHALARTLVTTRSREYGSLAKGVDLSVLMPDEAFQLLTSRRKPASNDDEKQARLLAEELGYHSLALDVTASALLSYGCDEIYRKFREELSDSADDALELSTRLADALPNGHEKSIARTMLRSIRGLGAEGQDFLRLASALAVAPIPASLVAAVFEKSDRLEQDKAEQRQRTAFNDVSKASLAEMSGEKQEARSVHTLVSRAMRFHEKVATERTLVLRSATIEWLSTKISEATPDPRLHKQIELLVVHARQLVAIIRTAPEAALARCVGLYDLERGSYASAYLLFERELGFRQVEQGPEHPPTLMAMSNLAETLRGKGDVSGARTLQEKALPILRRVLGHEHRDTLRTMSNLAETLRAQGHLSEARQMHGDVLALFIRSLGVEHPDTLASMSNLAESLRAQGDLGGARELQEECLVTKRRVLGPEHRDTLTTTSNLASTLSAQGDWAAARKLQEDVLEVRVRLLGPEHPDSLYSMQALASTLWAQGDLEGSRNLEENVLAAHRRLLGPEHPRTLTSMNNLAETLRAQGYLTDASTLHRDALEARVRLLGPEHPETLQSMNNLGEALREQGDLGGARKLQEESLAIKRRVLGFDHPDTLTTMCNLAATLIAEGDLAEGSELLQEALALFRRMFGAEHPDTLTAMGNLAESLREQGDLGGARKLQEECLAIRSQVLGLEHPDTSISAWNLFITLHHMAEREAGRALLERDLVWLLNRDPTTLGADQRKIREMAARAFEDYLPERHD